ENGIRQIRLGGQRDHVRAEAFEGLLVSAVLLPGTRQVNGLPGDVAQLALREPCADPACECDEHAAPGQCTPGPPPDPRFHASSHSRSAKHWYPVGRATRFRARGIYASKLRGSAGGQPVYES